MYHDEALLMTTFKPEKPTNYCIQENFLPPPPLQETTTAPSLHLPLLTVGRFKAGLIENCKKPQLKKT